VLFSWTEICQKPVGFCEKLTRQNRSPRVLSVDQNRLAKFQIFYFLEKLESISRFLSKLNSKIQNNASEKIVKVQNSAKIVKKIARFSHPPINWFLGSLLLTSSIRWVRKQGAAVPVCSPSLSVFMRYLMEFEF
jgi:hypothetical protein